MRKKFCCDASKHLYEQYYVDQSGSGIPVFVGSRGQRGHGLGSLLSGLFRSAFPMIKRGLATFGKHALKTGLEIANDVVEGNSLKESAKRRVPEGIKRFANPANFSNQSGSGRARSKKRRKAAGKKKRKKAKINDIFA
jgi:hypothetical protein